MPSETSAGPMSTHSSLPTFREEQFVETVRCVLRPCADQQVAWFPVSENLLDDQRGLPANAWTGKHGSAFGVRRAGKMEIAPLAQVKGTPKHLTCVVSHQDSKRRSSRVNVDGANRRTCSRIG